MNTCEINYVTYERMIQEAKEALSCCMTSFTNAGSCTRGVAELCAMGSSLSSPSIPVSVIFHLHPFTKTPFWEINIKVYSVSTLPVIHKTYTIPFPVANRMWCSITLTPLLLLDTSMQFSDGFLPVRAESGFSTSLLYPLMQSSNGRYSEPNALPLSTSVKSGSSYFKHSP